MKGRVKRSISDVLLGELLYEIIKTGRFAVVSEKAKQLEGTSGILTMTENRL